jgi:hypothetical protein
VTTILLIIVLAVIALVLWLVPVDPAIRKLLIAVAVIAVVAWGIYLIFGGIHGGRIIIRD